MTSSVSSAKTEDMNSGYFGNYQLLGDSQFVRFCVQILDLKSKLDDKRRAQVGFCISGQDSTGLSELVAQNYNYLHNNLIIMIGTNDVRKEVHKHTFTKAIYSLKSTLKWKTVLWLTIPPIPKFKDSKTHVKKLKYFNTEIMKLHGDNIYVLDVYNLFIDENNRFMDHCFEDYYYSRKPPLREDNIHLNRKGLVKLCTWLCFHLLPQKFDNIQLYQERKGDLDHIKLYREFLFLSKFLSYSTITRHELYAYIMGPQKTLEHPHI